MSSRRMGTEAHLAVLGDHVWSRRARPGLCRPNPGYRTVPGGEKSCRLRCGRWWWLESARSEPTQSVEDLGSLRSTTELLAGHRRAPPPWDRSAILLRTAESVCSRRLGPGRPVVLACLLRSPVDSPIQKLRWNRR